LIMSRMLSDVLRSDEYNQGNGMLFYKDGDTQLNCCLGVMECEMGMEFTHDGYDLWRDNFGGTEMPRTLVLEITALDFQITDEEIRYIEDAYDVMDLTVEYTRANVLATLNDDGVSFIGIAEALEILGWDVDLDYAKRAFESHIAGVGGVSVRV